MNNKDKANYLYLTNLYLTEVTLTANSSSLSGLSNKGKSTRFLKGGVFSFLNILSTVFTCPDIKAKLSKT